jgi:hypothetical protein
VQKHAATTLTPAASGHFHLYDSRNGHLICWVNNASLGRDYQFRGTDVGLLPHTLENTDPSAVIWPEV